MTDYFPNQPDYLRISQEDSANAVMPPKKADGLTSPHKTERDIGDDYAAVGVTKCGAG